MGERIRVGLKYCGGCNPEYDRVALVKHIEESLQGRVKLTRFHATLKGDYLVW